MFEDVEKSMAQNDKELTAKAKEKYAELKRLCPNDDSQAAADIARSAKVDEFRRIVRQYLDEGLDVYEAQKRAIQDFEDTEVLREPNSNILDYLE